MNYQDTATVTRRNVTADPATGQAVTTTATVLDGVRCLLSPLSAVQAVESWGEAIPTRTNTASASLWLPYWQTILPEPTYTLDAYSVSVAGSPYVWRIQGVKVWSDFTHYLLSTTT